MIANRFYTIIIILTIGICSNLNAGWKDALFDRLKIDSSRGQEIKDSAYGFAGGVLFVSLVYSTKDLIRRFGKYMGYNTQPKVHGLIITTTFGALLYSYWSQNNSIPFEKVNPKSAAHSDPAVLGIAGNKMKGFLGGIGASLLLGNTANEALSQFPYKLDIAFKKVCSKNVSGC